MFMSIINKKFKMSSDPSQEGKYPPTTSSSQSTNPQHQNPNPQENPNPQVSSSYPPVHREEWNVQVPTLGV